MRDFEKRLAMIELKQRTAARYAVIQIDDLRIQAGISVAQQLAEQEQALGFPVPGSTKQQILANAGMRRNGTSIYFFDSTEE